MFQNEAPLMSRVLAAKLTLSRPLDLSSGCNYLLTCVSRRLYMMVVPSLNLFFSLKALR